ncbi:MAG: transcription termination/antitermination protein NusG [Phascolarctobacterium sp.]|nr:transcription termination/antitermination protein NusG [Phascolarctobacterium sp.]MBO5403694.1 transcription termination/antitermination protein NusG [Phascolarctobacterium sp.]MBQ2975138.1 transcription termination/antitermination protein NusG [Phascolarctobacterium sp.]MBQ3114006.1 transcription termination/antitermination protein NusG [Phascolarctobacterium sp.]MBQ3540300.1 transcription termination/antitermination protein NusG [Phascolarctobacterium sp.]
MEEKQEKRWYVIHTYSGYENKVSANLERKVHSLGMENEIFRIVIPMENEVEIKDGKKRSVQRKVFPGYVLVEMIVNDRSWYAVRNTPGVTGFVGSGSKPIPLTEDEVRQIMRSMGVEESRPKIDFQLHQLVRLKSGPFADCLGKVSEINEERGKLKVLVDMFGRETPVEIDFTQVEEAE